MPPHQPTLEELIDRLRDTAIDYVQDLFQTAAGGLKDRMAGVQLPNQSPAPGTHPRRVRSGPGRVPRAPRANPGPKPGKPVRTAYTVLGVDPSAEPEVVAVAYKAKARLYHPDIAKDSKQADERMKELNAAWEILKDPKKRAEYDKWLGSKR